MDVTKDLSFGGFLCVVVLVGRPVFPFSEGVGLPKTFSLAPGE